MEILSHITFDRGASLTQIGNFFPQEVLAMFELIVEDINKANTSNSILPLAIIAALWAASKGIMAIISGLNMAYKEKETRSYIYLRVLSLIYTVAFAFIILMTLGLIVFGNKILALLIAKIPFLVYWDKVFDIFRIIFSTLLLFLFFVLLYNATPNHKITIRDVVPGAIFASAGWMLVAYFFSIYVNKSKSFSYMYGSLTSIIILLLWLYICSTIIMIGGEINAVISEHRKN